MKTRPIPLVIAAAVLLLGVKISNLWSVLDARAATEQATSRAAQAGVPAADPAEGNSETEAAAPAAARAPARQPKKKQESTPALLCFSPPVVLKGQGSGRARGRPADDEPIGD